MSRKDKRTVAVKMVVTLNLGSHNAISTEFEFQQDALISVMVRLLLCTCYAQACCYTCFALACVAKELKPFCAFWSHNTNLCLFLANTCTLTWCRAKPTNLGGTCANKDILHKIANGALHYLKNPSQTESLSR